MTRVISGRFRGQVLVTPAGDHTRPTSDRVRESFFSSLGSWLGTADQPAAQALAGVGFLDLYAGSGACGIEAASRGARQVHLVEQNPRVMAVARQNATRLGLRLKLTRGAVAAVLARPAPEPYDVVWLDPPYRLADSELAGVLQRVVHNGWLARAGLLVVERSSRSPDPQPPPGLTEQWSRRYGETTIHYATRAPSQEDSES